MRFHAGYVTFLAGTAALGGFLFGFDSAVINGAVGGLQQGFGASNAGTGFAVASILLGCAAGALVAGRLADRVGRRPVMVACAVVFAVTAVWAGGARSATAFTIAPLASGIAVGAASVVCPAYIAEISPARMRGRLASLQHLGIVVGIFAALQSDEWLARIAGGASAWASSPASTQVVLGLLNTGTRPRGSGRRGHHDQASTGRVSAQRRGRRQGHDPGQARRRESPNAGTAHSYECARVVREGWIRQRAGRARGFRDSPEDAGTADGRGRGSRFREARVDACGTEHDGIEAETGRHG
jgi:hypothetical protein